MISEFLESLERDRFFSLQIAEHRYIPPLKPRYRDITIDERLREILRDEGITRFWSHQVEAIDIIRQGENVVVMTPTASGKSLVYNIPVIESIMERPETRALYIFPLKGLEQDQVKNLNRIFQRLGISHGQEGSKRLRLEPAEV
ncbi:MAG: DEAD/DEAH box helicase, partial [Thermodesulfovibrionales bacterium]